MNNNHENTMKKLEEYRKEPGFTVPDGYYDDLYEKMMSRVSVEHHRSNKQKRIFRFSMVGSAAAAAIALLVTVNLLNQNNPTDFVTDVNENISKIEQTSTVPLNTEVAQTTEIISNSEISNKSRNGNGTSKSVNKPTNVSTYTNNSVDIEDPVLEFYEEDARSDQFQEALMDLECYYEF